ncbi:MAG: protein translocase subunit SecF [Patescibacteria group bacterium]
MSRPSIIHSSRVWFIFSGVLSIASIIAIATWGLRVGIDFKGGQLIETRFTEPVPIETIRDHLKDANGVPSSTVVESGPNTFLIRTTTDTPEQLTALKTQLDGVGEREQIRFESVGPTVGKDLTQKAILAVVLASIAIILYIAWAFRHVPKPTNSWQFGITAAIALLHDLLITIGAFSLLGHLYGFEVDSLFITALLTVMGFSVHDTIVTYDRIRENLLEHMKDMSFKNIVVSSINQTLVRSMNTSLTLILILSSLILLGGESIKPFIAALLIGVSVGAYSSVFLASQLLITWQQWAEKRTVRHTA